MTTDPIAEMLTKIRNANSKNLFETEVYFSKMKEKILSILKREGFIKDYTIIKKGTVPFIKIFLQYFEDKKQVIHRIRRISKPSVRTYANKGKIPKPSGVLGVIVLSTPKGILTDKEAKNLGVGGEVLFEIY